MAESNCQSAKRDQFQTLILESMKRSELPPIQAKWIRVALPLLSPSWGCSRGYVADAVVGSVAVPVAGEGLLLVT